jgi:hypothetical protein
MHANIVPLAWDKYPRVHVPLKGTSSTPLKYTLVLLVKESHPQTRVPVGPRKISGGPDLSFDA